jgi:hypothetical protein
MKTWYVSHHEPDRVGDRQRKEWWLTHQACKVVRDFWSTNNRTARGEDRVGLDNIMDRRKTRANVYQPAQKTHSTLRSERRIPEDNLTDLPKRDQRPGVWVRQRKRGVDVSADVEPRSLRIEGAGQCLSTNEQGQKEEEHAHDREC